MLWIPDAARPARSRTAKVEAWPARQPLLLLPRSTRNLLLLPNLSRQSRKMTTPNAPAELAAGGETDHGIPLEGRRKMLVEDSISVSWPGLSGVSEVLTDWSGLVAVRKQAVA